MSVKMAKMVQFLNMSPIESAKPELLEIRIYPDPYLKVKCRPVIEITKEIKALIQNMFLTMYQANGAGLSANQVGHDVRIFVMDTSASGARRRVFINPEIIKQNEPEPWKEGCLSFPDIFATVKRHTKIKVRALDEEGQTFEMELESIDAICFQHELNHLDGETFYDHLSPLKKNMLRKKIANLKK